MAVALADWHSYGERTADPPLVYKVTDGGILVQGEATERRTRGEPTTLRGILDRFGDHIAHACSTLNVPEALVAGMIAAESHGKSDAERGEGHLRDRSIGLTQTLTATAHQLAKGSSPELQLELGVALAATTTPLPKGGDVDIWRPILSNPRTAIGLGALYFHVANQRQRLRCDPVLCYAAYNAGSVRPSKTTPWGMHYYRKQLPNGSWADAMNSFVKWYGDACAALNERKEA